MNSGNCYILSRFMSASDMTGGRQSAESDFDLVYFILRVAAKLLLILLESLCISMFVCLLFSSIE